MDSSATRIGFRRTAASIFRVERQVERDKSVQDTEKRKIGGFGGASSRWQPFSVCV
jgi:hypothetical protein